MSKLQSGEAAPAQESAGRSAAGPHEAAASEDAAALWFHRRATYYVEAQALFHLNQVGVFASLAQGGAFSPAELAQRHGLVEPVLASLLEYVQAVDELLEKDDAGRYRLSSRGQAIVRRFSTAQADSPPRINLFDVRVGGYGPVFCQLGKMLTGAAEYGRDFQRDGRYAEGGVRKLAMHFWPTLQRLLAELPVTQALELGLTTGILERIGVERPQLALYGLDRSAAALASAGAHAAGLRVDRIRWLHADLFQTERWLPAVHANEPGLIYSLHFHEFLAAGEARLVDWLQRLRAALPGWYVVALEQPRLPDDARATLRESQWLYAQSNVLIHHLIGNARILSHPEWLALGGAAGCTLHSDRPCDYLGYRAFVFQL
jgi:hypothetical protein